MKTKDENQLAMWIVVLDFLKNKTEFTNTIEAFAPLIVTFGSLIDQAMLIMKALGYNTSNLTSDKRMKKETVVITLYRLKSMIRAYANKIKDNILFDSMKGKPSSLRRLTDLELLAKANEIYDVAIKLGDAIAPFGGKVDFLKECQKAIKEFTDSQPKSRSGIEDHKHSNEELASVMTDGKATLKEIDDLVEIERHTQPLIYSDYWNRHKVINVGHRFLSVQFHVVDDATGKPMKGVVIKFWKKDNELNEVTTKKSSDKGGSNVKGLFTDEYEYEATFVGCVKSKGPFVYSEGKKIDVNIRMKKKVDGEVEGLKGEKGSGQE